MKRSLRLILSVVLLSTPALAAQDDRAQPMPSPLVRLLKSKGIITEQEAAQIDDGSPSAESERRLA